MVRKLIAHDAAAMAVGHARASVRIAAGTVVVVCACAWETAAYPDENETAAMVEFDAHIAAMTPPSSVP